MAAIITDQLRILNAKNFVSAATSSVNSYYSFVGLPNPSNYSSTWDANPPSPKDSFDQEDDYFDDRMIKKMNVLDDSPLIEVLGDNLDERRYEGMPFIEIQSEELVDIDKVHSYV